MTVLSLFLRYNQTHTIEERAAVARDFIAHNDYDFPIMLDVPPKNEFDKLFAAWPLRFYVIENGRLTFICEPYGIVFTFGSDIVLKRFCILGEYILISDLASFFTLRFGPKVD
jgi:hypothetical protein